MHKFTIHGMITELRADSFIVSMDDPQKLKNVIATYGELDFVPLIGHDGCKVKYGEYAKLAKQMHKSPLEVVGQHKDASCDFVVKIRKNEVNSCGRIGKSLSLLLLSIK